jgi:serine/threonine protein kinase/alpha-tubulin suppressor-like RCC1 family protein
MSDHDRLSTGLAGLGPEFELVRELGRGTTAVVYLVRDRTLGRDVALKVMRASFLHDDEAVARLQREARLVAQLQHPNIVKLYGTRQLADGSLALLMEHVPGRSLKEVVRQEGPLPSRRALAILRDVASALAYAHRRRIVHRDVKPENIYIDDEVGAARLADFGVARPWDRDTRLTLPGESLGTPAYMSPEQIDNAEVDGRTDVYSLGLVGYEMLAGRHPWEGENLYSVIFKQKNEDLPPIASIRRDAPRALVRILEKALCKNPQERWESADAMLSRLASVDPDGPSQTHEPLAPAGPWGRADSDASPRMAAAVMPPDRDDPPPARREPPPPGRVEPPVPPRSGNGWQLEPLPRMPAVEPGRGETREPAPAASSEPVRAEPPEPARAEARETPPPPPASWQGSWLEPRPSASPPEVPEPARPPARRRRRRLGGIGAGVAAVVVTLFLAAIATSGLLTRGGEGEGATLEPEGTPTGGGATSAPPSAVAAAVADPGSVPPTLALAEPAVVEGDPGEALPVLIRVSGPDGSPLPGVLVRLRGEEGVGRVVLDSVVSDAEGVARAGVILPGSPGPMALMASVPGHEGAELRLELTARGAVAADLTWLIGNGQEGPVDAPLSQPLGVRVRDALGNPLAGAEVEFRILEGGGTVGPALTRTDDQGRAFARWRTGPEPGPQRVEAVLAGAGLAVEFTAEAVAAAPEPEAPPPDSTVPATSPDAAGDPPVAPVTPAAAAASPTVRERGFVVGGTHVCGLDAGSRAGCRGADDRGQRRGASAAPMVFLTAGVIHGCGLDASGQAFCWGANENGQLGDGTRGDRDTAVPVETDMRFGSLAAGLAHTCGLDATGRAWCWGRNLNGQLGDGSRDDRTAPAPAAGDARFVSLTAGWNHTCGLDAGGRAWCWGLSSDGQVGGGSRLDRLQPTRLTGSPAFQSLTAGSAHTCGLSGGEVLCWGDNQFGQLGDGTTADADRPAGAAGLPGPVRRVVAGAVHTCALLDDGRAFCWGQDLHGQLGDGEAGGSRSTPAEVTGDFRFRALEAGGGVTCGVTEVGVQYCWGLNQSGQLGDGTRTNRAVPTRAGG